jgi:hypothetical protein
MQRNEANEIALYYNLKGVPYQKALTHETVKYNFRKVGKAFLLYTPSIKQVTESFKMMAEVLKNENRTN